MRYDMTSGPVRFGLLAALLAVTASARAETLTADFNGVSPGETVTVTYNNVAYKNLSAGYFNWINVSPATSTFAPQFQSFCVEINRGVLSQTTFNTTPLQPRYSASQSARLREFWGENFAGVGANPTRAAAFQLGIWEIVGEDGTTALDLASGNFTGDSSPDSNAAIEQAKTWLNAVDGQGTFEDNLLILDSESSQDQINTTSTVVPVPPAVLMGGMGLMSLVGYGLRRRQTARKAAAEAKCEENA